MKLEAALENFLRETVEQLPAGGKADPQQTIGVERVLQRAAIHALYAEQKTIDGGDVLVAMLRSSNARFWLPTFAVIGFLAAGYPLMTFTVFVGLAASWTYYASFYRFVEESRKGGVRV